MIIVIMIPTALSTFGALLKTHGITPEIRRLRLKDPCNELLPCCQVVFVNNLLHLCILYTVPRTYPLSIEQKDKFCKVLTYLMASDADEFVDLNH